MLGAGMPGFAGLWGVIQVQTQLGPGSFSSVSASLSSETGRAPLLPSKTTSIRSIWYILAPDDTGEGHSPASGVQSAERWRRGNQVLLWSALLFQLQGCGCEKRRLRPGEGGQGRNIVESLGRETDTFAKWLFCSLGRIAFSYSSVSLSDVLFHSPAAGEEVVVLTTGDSTGPG